MIIFALFLAIRKRSLTYGHPDKAGIKQEVEL